MREIDLRTAQEPTLTSGYLRMLRASSQSMSGSGRVHPAGVKTNALTSGNANPPPANRHITVTIYAGSGQEPFCGVLHLNTLTLGYWHLAQTRTRACWLDMWREIASDADSRGGGG